MSSHLVPYQPFTNRLPRVERKGDIVPVSTFIDRSKAYGAWLIREERGAARFACLMWQYTSDELHTIIHALPSPSASQHIDFYSLLTDPDVELIEKAKPKASRAVAYTSDATTVLAPDVFDEMIELADRPTVSDALRADMAAFRAKHGSSRGTD